MDTTKNLIKIIPLNFSPLSIYSYRQEQLLMYSSKLIIEYEYNKIDDS